MPDRVPPRILPPAGALLLVLLLAACTHRMPGGPFAEAELVDLSHAFGPDTLYWPTDTRGFEYERLAWGRDDRGLWYAAGRFATAEHGGTHVDAPIHFHAAGAAVDRIPLERLLGPAVVVDARAACAADRDHRIGKAEIEAFEAAQGRIPDGAIVLLRTGWSRHFHDRARYLGTAARGPEAVRDLHFPGLDPEAARWLVEERAVAAVGIDTASIDPGPSTRFESHRVLAAAGVPIFENLARLGRLPPRDFAVIALPVKIEGGSGAPLRAVAVLP